MKTIEERVSSLEENFAFMREGIARVEKTLEKLDASVLSLVERLDARYPSKESVDLRMAEIVRDIKTLRERQDALEARAMKIAAWQYRVIGGLVVVSFVLGVLSRLWKW